MEKVLLGFRGNISQGMSVFLLRFIPFFYLETGTFVFSSVTKPGVLAFPLRVFSPYYGFFRIPPP